MNQANPVRTDLAHLRTEARNPRTLHIDTRGAQIWFDRAGAGVPATAVNVNTVSEMVVSPYGYRHLPVSGIGDRRIRIRSEKDGSRSNKWILRKPDMELSAEIEYRIDTDVPDPRRWSLKAQKNQLASRGTLISLIGKRDLCRVESKGDLCFFSENKGDALDLLSGWRHKTNRVEIWLICPKFHAKTIFPFCDAKFHIVPFFLF